MSEPVEGVRGVVVAHGAMAEGLVDAVRRIAGTAADVLVAVSNEGTGPDELKAELMARAGEGPCVIFVDLLAGSCCAAAFASCRDSHDRRVVCGVNLPILLDFVFNRHLPPDELVSRLVEKGRESIKPLAPTGLLAAALNSLSCRESA